MSFFSGPSKSTRVTPSDTNYITDAVWSVNPGNIIQATSVDLTAETITYNSHGLNNGDILQIINKGTTDLSELITHFVVGVTTNTFQLSLTWGGSPVNIGGANTTAPQYQLKQTYSLNRVSGVIFVGTAGNVNVLPADHFDTNTATEANKGAITFNNIPAGTFLPIEVKKVFATGTTASNLDLVY